MVVFIFSFILFSIIQIVYKAGIISRFRSKGDSELELGGWVTDGWRVSPISKASVIKSDAVSITALLIPFSPGAVWVVRRPLPSVTDLLSELHPRTGDGLGACHFTNQLDRFSRTHLLVLGKLDDLWGHGWERTVRKWAPRRKREPQTFCCHLTLLSYWSVAHLSPSGPFRITLLLLQNIWADGPPWFVHLLILVPSEVAHTIYMAKFSICSLLRNLCLTLIFWVYILIPLIKQCLAF